MDGMIFVFSVQEHVSPDIISRSLKSAEYHGYHPVPVDQPGTIRYSGDSTDRIRTQLDRGEALSRYSSEGGRFHLRRPDPPHEFTVGNYSDQIRFTLNQNPWLSSEAPEISENIAEIIGDLHVSLSSRHTRTLIKPYLQFEIAREEETEGCWVFDTNQKVSWLTIFGEEEVKQYGKDRLLSVPAWKGKELSDSSVLIVLTENPNDLESYRSKYNSAREHLGIEHLPEA